jgi:peptidoglycan hydrolase CwlO-like protein
MFHTERIKTVVIVLTSVVILGVVAFFGAQYLFHDNDSENYLKSQQDQISQAKDLQSDLNSQTDEMNKQIQELQNQNQSTEGFVK